MGLISEIKKKIKLFFSDLRRDFGLLIIICIIWIMLLFGIIFLKVYVGPLEPLESFADLFDPAFVNLLTATIQVFLAALYVLVWLYLWYRLIRMYFWRTIKKYYPSSEETSEDEE